jgi:two-component system NarL family response regulator
MRVLIADDHPLWRIAVDAALADDEGFEVVAEASSGSEVLPLVAAASADLVLLDLAMPGADGLTCLDRLVKQHPQVKVVALSGSSDPELVEAAFQRGACGYIVKTIEIGELPAAIREAVNATSGQATGLPARHDDAAASAAGLTERELSVLRLLAVGLSNQEIARRLCVSQPTVKFHLANLYRKLQVANRTEATRWAFKHGLVVAEPASSDRSG